MPNRADQRKFHFVYKTTCKVTSKWYIGIHSSDDLNDGYVGSGQALSKSIKKYGKENHTFEILEYALDRKTLTLKKQSLLKDSSSDESGMNLKEGNERKFHVIYKTTCTVTGKWYIGMHSTDNLDDGYMGSGQILSKSIKKYGKHNHVYEILEYHPDRQTLGAREDEIPTEELRQHDLCMNIARGGIGNFSGYCPPEESRRKNSVASLKMWRELKAKGYKHPPQTEEAKAKRSIANTGKKRTEEQCKQFSKAQLAYHAQADKESIKERGRKAYETRLANGSVLGGRPKGSKCALDRPGTFKVSCMGCKKETSTAGLTRNHGPCFGEAKRLINHQQSTSSPKASCISCRRETTSAGITTYHQSCTRSLQLHKPKFKQHFGHVSCIGCKKETRTSGLTNFHQKCFPAQYST